MHGEPHEARINRLKSQIGQGQYRVDAVTIAKAILSYKQRDESLANPHAQSSLQARQASLRCPMYSYRANGQRKASALVAHLRPKKPLC